MTVEAGDPPTLGSINWLQTVRNKLQQLLATGQHALTAGAARNPAARAPFRSGWHVLDGSGGGGWAQYWIADELYQLVIIRFNR